MRGPFFQKDPPPPPSLTYFHGKSPKILENLFAMYHKPRIQCNCEKTPKFPSILKSHWKSSLRPFLHQALQLYENLKHFRCTSLQFCNIRSHQEGLWHENDKTLQKLNKGRWEKRQGTALSHSGLVKTLVLYKSKKLKYNDSTQYNYSNTYCRVSSAKWLVKNRKIGMKMLKNRKK